MESLSLDELCRNAYRVLGLTAGATQNEIESAARMLRLYEVGDAAATPNDAPWLGHLRRLPEDVEHALMRLSDPASRQAERVWWFCGTPNEQPESPDPPDESAFQARHDAALAGLIVLLKSGTAAIERWSDALAEFRMATGLAAYRRWSLAVEGRGEFEKRADIDEMAILHDRAMSLAAGAVRKLADDALRAESYGTAGRCIGLLREMSGGAAGLEEDIAQSLMNRMEDELAARCSACEDEIQSAWKDRRIETLRPACARAVGQYQSALQVLAAESVKWSADDSRRERIAARVTQLLWGIADAYEACYDQWSARETLLLAVPVANGTSREPQLHDRISRLRNAKREPQVPTTTGKGTRFRPTLIVVGVAVGLIRAFLSSSTITTSPSPSYNFTPPPPPQVFLPPNYHLPAPGDRPTTQELLQQAEEMLRGSPATRRGRTATTFPVE